MNTLLNQMMSQLSDEDKSIFSELAIKLNQFKGDVSQLSASDLKIIADMEKKYADKLSGFDQEIKENSSHSGELNSEVSSEIASETGSEFELLDTAFASYVRQLLARDLNSQFPKEDDAVKFAFQNKWIAQELKETQKTEEIFDLYKNDIGNANQWRETTVGVDADKSMAVGMTWFMVVFALNKSI